MRIKKVVKASRDCHCEENPKCEALHHIKKAMACLAMVENPDDRCSESIANLGVVLADLSDGEVDLGMKKADFESPLNDEVAPLPNGNAPSLGPVED